MIPIGNPHLGQTFIANDESYISISDLQFGHITFKFLSPLKALLFHLMLNLLGLYSIHQ